MRGSIKLRRQWKNAFNSKKYDPSLRDQLYARRDLPEGERMTSFFNAIAQAPFASFSTKSSWRRAANLD